MEFVRACPMCSAPVTFGGGMTITNFGFGEPIFGAKWPDFSHHSYHADSTSCGLYAFGMSALSTFLSPLGVASAFSSASLSASSSPASFFSRFFFSLGCAGAAAASAAFAAFAAALAFFSSLSRSFSSRLASLSGSSSFFSPDSSAFAAGAASPFLPFSFDDGAGVTSPPSSATLALSASNLSTSAFMASLPAPEAFMDFTFSPWAATAATAAWTSALPPLAEPAAPGAAEAVAGAHAPSVAHSVNPSACKGSFAMQPSSQVAVLGVEARAAGPSTFA
mmetsp:Transcript_12463/g.43263  ORF Transcript_12463/g.43263 Transcript_12463/m.43263 type:complete len:278 (+) Transcript_12463:2798-3631(+)